MIQLSSSRKALRIPGRSVRNCSKAFSSCTNQNRPCWANSWSPFYERTAVHSIRKHCPAPLLSYQFWNSRSYSVPHSISSDKTLPNFAFAFDIDGVLLRASDPLPGASKVLNYLHDREIPFILLTNGGGKHESQRVLELSKKLQVPLTIENFVQSHTPFKDMLNGSSGNLEHKTVLVTGSDQDKAREIAEVYGFKNVVTPGDIFQAYPKIWPFALENNTAHRSRPLPAPIDLADLSKSLKIDAIFIYNDPRDWGLDSQIILDLLLSKAGYLGTYSSKNGDQSLPNNGWQQDGQPSIIFSNPDLFWAAGYHMPRLGQGGFRSALDGIWAETTDGAKLIKTVIGKPYALTYRYGEKVLQKHRATLLGKRLSAKVPKLHRVFMVGDNPESDIRGANEFESPDGTEWTSILVKTGVFRDGTVPKYSPKATVDDVFAAVRWALEKEGYAKSGEL